jgi:hypothetical protein
VVVVIYAQLPEFTPWENEDFAGTGKADEFLRGFMNDFKPAFEKKYAISSDKDACTIMGADVVVPENYGMGQLVRAIKQAGYKAFKLETMRVLVKI